MNQLVYNFIKENQDYILTEWMSIMKENTDERLIKVVSDRMFTQTSSEFIDMIIAHVDSKNQEFTLKLSDFAENVINGMVENGIVTPENQVELVNHMDKWSTPINNEIVNIYTQTWEKTVSLQRMALQELSAPLIPVWEGITVMPLIGTIDTERAKQIMENLLTGVVKHRSEVVLIDITGVPVVDTMVAHHIIQAAEAVRLVGAKCMLCGIRPEIAQTIVNLGINLNEVITKNTLKKGIEVALELTSRKIVNVEGDL